MAKSNDPYREKFRADIDSALEKEIDDALGGMSIEDLVEHDQPKVRGAAEAAAHGFKKGRIIRISKDDAFIDFGGKTLGVASLTQFDEEPKVGDEMEFSVDRFDTRENLLILSKKGSVASNVSWENLDAGQIVEATVTGSNKGGLELEVKGMRAFMPAGQVELFHVPDFAQYVGQKMVAEVTQADRESRNIVLSRRNILEREKEEARVKMWAELAEGQIRRGTVRSIMDFGAFVDMGGVDGLLHVSEMSFRRGVKASDVVKVGDVLDVKIVKMDLETGRVGLSLKQARGIDPWMDAATKYAVGTLITGRVTKVEAFGAFIEVEEGIEGLLPISEMSYARVRSASDVCKEGDTLRLAVLSIDPVARRMSFSLKQAGPDPWKTANERYATDMIISGTVTRTTEFGAFVEVEPGMEGLIHISELSDKRVASASNVVKPGDPVQVQVLELDRDARRLSLSLKRAQRAAAVAAAPAPAPAEPEKPSKKQKKKPELRGGLDWKW